MSKSSLLFSTILLCALISACDGDSPTAPGGPQSYGGQWTGITSQGRLVTFVVSSDQKVTSLNIGYNFNGCAGEHSVSNLSLDIRNSPNPGAPSLGPTFGWVSGTPEGPNFTQVYGSFTSGEAATGTILLTGYAGCGAGNAVAAWSAGKR